MYILAQKMKKSFLRVTKEISEQYSLLTDTGKKYR